MNLVEALIYNLSRNTFNNSGEYKLLITQTIRMHKDYRKFCDNISSALDSLRIVDYQLSTSSSYKSSDKIRYKCALSIGNGDWKYDLHLAAYNLEGLQEESLLLHYTRVMEIPYVFNTMNKVYSSLEDMDLGSVTLKTTRIKQAISDAYKKEHRDALINTNNRLRSEAHILMCSKDMKNYVDSKRRTKIRKGIMSCLKQARTMGLPDDIRYFLGELEVEEIMES